MARKGSPTEELITSSEGLVDRVKQKVKDLTRRADGVTGGNAGAAPEESEPPRDVEIPLEEVEIPIEEAVRPPKAAASAESPASRSKPKNDALDDVDSLLADVDSLINE